MNIINKALMYFRIDGFIPTLKKTLKKIVKEFKKLPFAMLEKMIGKYLLKDLLEEAIGKKKIYIMIPGIDWKIPVYQRPHQISTELSKQENAIVIFISDQYEYDNFAGCKKVEDCLWLYSIRMTKYLNKIFDVESEKIIFMSWTRHESLLNKINYDKLVYEYIDELSLFYYYNEEMERIHQKLMKKADVTVCTAVKLYEKACKTTPRALLSENAGDYDFFKANRKVRPAEEIKNIVKDYSCVFGYYGCLAYWFDYETILGVADEKPDWLFVLIGYEFDLTSEKIKSCKNDNIVHIPAQPYARLPEFVVAFDILIIPFIINEVTESTSPIKLFEYMACGKPIITSKMPECMRYNSVKAYATKDEFITLAEEYLNMDKRDNYYNVLEKEALENTWKARVKSILEYIESVR